MFRAFTCCLAGLIIVTLSAPQAWALVTQESVTPDSIKEKESKFSVTAEIDKDGLIQFTISYRLPRPQYLVAHFELRDGQTVLLRTDTPGFVHEDSATYHVAVAPKQLAEAKFVLSENSIGQAGGRSVALPGGTIFQIDLQAFGKNLAAKAG